MGGVNSIPVISQVKSLVLLVSNQSDEARKVQEDFSKGCPIVSQVRSAVEAISGNSEAAKETQETFAKGAVDLAGGLPVVGQVLAAVELGLGNKEKAEEYLESSYRTCAVLCGTIVGGPIGAIAGGMAMDALQTGIASAITQDYHPTGLILGVTESIKSGDVGVMFDTAITPALDYYMGKSTSKARAGVRVNEVIVAEKQATWVKFKNSTIEMRQKLQAEGIPEDQADRDIYKTVKIGQDLQKFAQDSRLCETDKSTKPKMPVFCYMDADSGARSASGFNFTARQFLESKSPEVIEKISQHKIKLVEHWDTPSGWNEIREKAVRRVKEDEPDVKEGTKEYDEAVSKKTMEIFDTKTNTVYFKYSDYFEEKNGSQLMKDQSGYYAKKKASQLMEDQSGKKKPLKKKPLNRDHWRCAEHEAYEWLSKERPRQRPEETYSFKVDEDGKAVPYNRCSHCKLYNLGRCPTDILHGLGIPEMKVPDRFPPDEIFNLVKQRRSLIREARCQVAVRTPTDALNDRFMDHEKREDAIGEHIKALEDSEGRLNQREDSAQKAAMLSEVLVTKGSLLALLSKNDEAIEAFGKASQLATKGNDTWIHAQYGKAFCLQLAIMDEDAIESWSQLLTERIHQVESEIEPHMTVLDATIAHHLGMLLLHNKKQHQVAGVLLATAQRLMQVYADHESTRHILTPHTIRVYKDDEMRALEGKSAVISIPMHDNVLAVSKIHVWCESRGTSGYGQIDILNHADEPVASARVYEDKDGCLGWTRQSITLTDAKFLDAIEPGFSIQLNICNMSQARNCDVTVEFITMEESLSFFDYFLQVDSDGTHECSVEEGTMDIATIDFSRIPKDKHFKACSSIRLFCESHDQGVSGYGNDWGSSRNSWTCGKIAIVAGNGEIVADRVVFRNRHAVPEWQQHTIDIDDIDFLSKIQPQMRIVFQIQAQYPGWRATVRNFDFRLHCVGF